MNTAGDSDMLLTLFHMFNNTLPVVRARTRRYFGFDGLWWPEYTHPLYGTTHPNSYGCNREGGKSTTKGEPVWHSEDRWNGYNRQGSLDLSLMILDHYAYTAKDNGMLGIPMGVIEFYSNLWSNTTTVAARTDNEELHSARNGTRAGTEAVGTMVFYPTQSLETWQCPGWPVDPTNCPTNDMPTVAGIRAVLEKLLRLPSDLVTAAQKQAWQMMLSKTPALPTRSVSGTRAFIPCDNCVRPGSGPPSPPVSCKPWNCTCTGMTDLYGTEGGIGFGCAPAGAQAWWKQKKCSNTKASPCASPPAAGCGTGVEHTTVGCCPACSKKPPSPTPTPTPTPPGPLPPGTGPGCHHTSNVENSELYAVHPYRMATVARGDAGATAAANAAFKLQVFKGDSGWNQNAMDAALLGNALAASGYVLARATTPPAKGYRFPTFAPHEQDYEPSSDHFSVMQNAVQYMLMAPVDDDAHSVVLLPAWPCSWDATFKLHAPLNTTITGHITDGKLQYAVVPALRASAVKAAKCQTV